MVHAYRVRAMVAGADVKSPLRTGFFVPSFFTKDRCSSMSNFTYRGTPAYKHVYDALVRAARTRDTVSYKEVAKLMGILLNGDNARRSLGQMLGEISEDEHANSRPMLSAIAVSKDGVPGEGFFNLAADLGLLSPNTPGGWDGFWQREREKVYDAWSS